MRRFVLTGAPGSGKTALLRALELAGHPVIEEAATDVIAVEQARGIAEPWRDPGFVDAVCRLQTRRQTAAPAAGDGPQFYDRSPVCTLALARFLGHPVSDALRRELDRVVTERIYERRVLFVDLLGFVTPSAARRIELDEARRFAQLHRETYDGLGYATVSIPPGPLDERLSAVLSAVGR